MQLFYAEPAAFDDTVLQTVTPLLPQEKQQSIAKIRHAPTRRQATLAWALLLYALQLRSPGESLPPLGFTEAGKPFFVGSDLHFNLSHTDTLVCLALSDRPVGVDAQTLLTPSDGVAKRVLTSAELALFEKADDKAALFTRFWTQKEACAKRSGEGLSRGFSTLDFAPYAQLDAFSAYDCSFRVWTLCGAVLTVCGQDAAAMPQAVTPEMLKKVLLA